MKNEHDSREKLEADVRKHRSHTTSTSMYPPSAVKRTDWLAPMPMDTVLGWLDRQEAITADEVARERYDMERALIAERDEWKAKAERIDEQTDDEPPQGDALRWLRKWIAGHDPQLRGHGLAGLETIADMIERDYVRRDAIEEVMDNDRALVEENAKFARELLKLTAELEKATNNLNSANEDFENARAELTAERDAYRERFGTCADLAEQMRNVAMRVMER